MGKMLPKVTPAWKLYVVLLLLNGSFNTQLLFSTRKVILIKLICVNMAEKQMILSAIVKTEKDLYFYDKTYPTQVRIRGNMKVFLHLLTEPVYTLNKMS
jgi:hypothetical protein